MKQFFLKHRKWMLYTLYGVIIAFALLIFRFPSDTLMNYIQAQLQDKYPNLLLSAQKVSLSFPIGLKITGAELSTIVPPDQTVFSAAKVIIRPRLMSLLGSSPQYRFRCQAYGGSIKGQADIRENGEETSFRLTADFFEIHLDENATLPAYIKGYFSGILGGSVAFSGSGLSDPDGTGEVSLTLSNGTLNFAQPLLNISAIDFEEVPIKAGLKGQNLNISSARLKGKDFLGMASGMIALKSPIKKSILDLEVKIEPTTAFMQDSGRNDAASNLIKQVFKNGKTFKVTGTVENPSFN